MSGEGTIITLIAAIATVLGFDAIIVIGLPLFLAWIETRGQRNIAGGGSGVSAARALSNGDALTHRDGGL